ncbi:hypothetical protein MUB23_06575 [Cuneatibacter sp. NSJ-177]|uniref:hypothetical protein n=1 Tax=Cuneatibacter sp. NSJ-177 TaxID=2931401 RepID=UPI001FD36A32|nr:hypothetical protein [Cuneatibacter sp. NSJ-177]MCJ7835059.1 hypothetical protein [Cuneatibacter sp. NSJ-177]
MTDREILESMADIIRPVIDRLDQLEELLNKLEAEVKKINVTLEKVTNHSIQIIAEGQDNMHCRLGALLESPQNMADRIRLNELEGKVNRLQADVDELKTKLA